MADTSPSSSSVRFENGIYQSKTAVYDYSSHIGTITLETFVEGITKIIKQDAPADVLMMVDVSTSMETNEMAFLKEAMNLFIDSLSVRSTADVQHRVAILPWGDKYANLSVLCGFTSLYSGKSTVTNAMNRLPSKGNVSSTLHDAALQKGYEVMQTARTDALKYVIYFTDDNLNASPETKSDESVQIAKQIKDMGASVFCIEYATFSVTSSRQRALGFLNAVSSNYPTATALSTDYEAHGYLYHLPDGQSSQLKNVFSGITEEVVKGIAAANLGIETLVKDYINYVEFRLPPGTTEDDIVVKTANCIGVADPPAGEENKVYSFGPDQDLTPSEEAGIQIKVVHKEGNEDDYVDVLGFDYAANWCGLDQHNTPRGKKLIIRIPFIFKGDEHSGALDTNSGESGVYTPDPEHPDPEDPQHYNPPKPYPIPTIKFCDLIIKCNGLADGDHEIFQVLSGDTVLETVVVSGAAPQATVTPLPEGNYTVKGQNWAWSYTYTTPQSVNKDIELEYTDESHSPTYEFTLQPKEDTADKAENSQNNVFAQ
ncbi:MAG: VWA domain-containing protein [Bacteroidales bacterium]|nr:VWA domain-containing protein [Bacteroidales bacterium]